MANEFQNLSANAQKAKVIECLKGDETLPGCIPIDDLRHLPDEVRHAPRVREAAKAKIAQLFAENGGYCTAEAKTVSEAFDLTSKDMNDPRITKAAENERDLTKIRVLDFLQRGYPASGIVSIHTSCSPSPDLHHDAEIQSLARGIMLNDIRDGKISFAKHVADLYDIPEAFIRSDEVRSAAEIGLKRYADTKNLSELDGRTQDQLRQLHGRKGFVDPNSTAALQPNERVQIFGEILQGEAPPIGSGHSARVISLPHSGTDRYAGTVRHDRIGVTDEWFTVELDNPISTNEYPHGRYRWTYSVDGKFKTFSTVEKLEDRTVDTTENALQWTQRPANLAERNHGDFALRWLLHSYRDPAPAY